MRSRTYLVVRHGQRAGAASCGCFPRRGRSQGRAIAWSAWGFTLLELVVSMAIATVLMLDIGSAMLIASRAAPDAASPAGAAVSAAQCCEQLMAELQYAISIDNRSAPAL